MSRSVDPLSCASPVHSHAGWLALLAMTLLMPGACKRKEAEPTRRDPPVSPSRAVPRDRADAAVPVPAPPRPAPPMDGPASANLPPAPLRPAAHPAPPRLSAFVAALEVTKGQPFAPKPLLSQHLGASDELGSLDGLPAEVTALVLRVGEDPLEAAIVILSPKGYQLCKDHPNPITFSVFEPAAPGGKTLLEVRLMEENLRADMKPKVELSPDFAATRAFLVHHEIDEDSEGCEPNPGGGVPTTTSLAALFKVGRQRLLLYKTFATARSRGAWGVTESERTDLTWYASARPGVRYLGVVVDSSKRVVNTAGDLNYEGYSCTRHVSVIAMERGKVWKFHAGQALQRLMPGEAALASLPKDMTGISRKTCPF